MTRSPQNRGCGLGRSGTSIATALIVAALALTLALTMAAVGYSHLTVGRKLSNSYQAKALAEAALAQAIERIVTREGDFFETPPLELTVTLKGAPGGTGRLTFDSEEAAAWGIPLSTYNLKKDVSVNGAGGRMVPKRSIHFVAVGEYLGSSKRLEAILHIPTFKYALASSGPIASQGELFVASTEDPADVVASDAEAKLGPGNIVSNSTNSTAAVDFAGSTGIEITGDVKAAGGIDKGPALVKGQEFPNADPVDLPVVEITDFDPRNFGSTQDFPVAPGPVAKADGLFFHNGDLTLQKLKLPDDNSGAIVWVKGDLTINDGVSGVGALFATGNLTIHNAGNSDVTSDNTVAVVAGKKLEVKGSGSGTAFFRGVVASGGDALLQDVTVVGAAVVGSTRVNDVAVGGASPTVRLTDARLINFPEAIEFEFEFPFGMGAGGAGGAGQGWSVAGNPPAGQVWDIRLQPGVKLANFYDSASGDFVADWSQWDGFTPYSYDEATHSNSGSPFGYYLSDGTRLTRNQLKTLIDQVGSNYGPILGGGSPPNSYPDWASFFAAEPVTNFDELIDGMNAWVLNGGKGFKKQLSDANLAYDNQLKNQPQEKGTFSLDPNRFIGWDSRTSILLWREF